MTWAFGTWDATGVDNNTGIVKVNAVGTMQFDVNFTGSQTFNLPPGYSLAYLHQAGGSFSSSKRMLITISGATVTVSDVAANNYSPGTMAKYETNFIVVYAR
jgi:hypothetical protein